jgi:hypothetical protein
MVIDAETHERFYAEICFVNGFNIGFYFPPFEFYIRKRIRKEWVMPGQLGHNLMDHHFRCG